MGEGSARERKGEPVGRSDLVRGCNAEIASARTRALAARELAFTVRAEGGLDGVVRNAVEQAEQADPRRPVAGDLGCVAGSSDDAIELFVSL